MMKMLLELAERCEAATVPDRELDREIELAIYPDRVSPPVGLGLLAYTASLDAAMTLVPEGWEWAVGMAEGKRIAGCRQPGPGAPCPEIEAATPALALCAAALRARAALEQTHEQEMK